jgi:RecA/RadA recombinase
MGEQEKLIEATVKALNKQFETEVAHTLSEAYAPEKVRGFIPTGNLAIDYVIGKPGLPLGRITEIAGKPGRVNRQS